MKAKEVDKKFDEGEDVLEYFDTENIERPNEELKRINVDFHTWMLNGMDRKAKHMGINRQAILKVWVAEKLEQPQTVKSQK